MKVIVGHKTILCMYACITALSVYTNVYVHVYVYVYLHVHVYMYEYVCVRVDASV